jgi:thiol:disulfide interchange protein DsbD
LLDRETFICLWIVIFAFLGLYLLGKIKLAHDTDDDGRLSTVRMVLALISFSFAVYMVPGLWGAPLKAISAFAPPMSTQDFNLYDEGVAASYTDYDEGLAAARRSGKPVLVDFSGFGCVNCRKMEASVWTDPKVKAIIENDYILVSLMVDDKTPLATPITVTENGKQRTLKTVGDKWSYLQRYKFGANAQPFYVLVDADGQPLAGSYAYNEDVDAYVNFLQKGVNP